MGVAGMPGTIKVVGLTYKVLLEEGLKGSRNEALWGQHLSNPQEIRIASVVTEERRVNILLHEILHALYERCCLEDGAKEETVVEALANGISAVLADNPKLRAYLNEVYR